MPTLINKARLNNMNIRTFNIGDRWLDIGDLENYEKALETIENWD